MDALGWAGAPPAGPQRYWSQLEAKWVWALSLILPLNPCSSAPWGSQAHTRSPVLQHKVQSHHPSPMVTCAPGPTPASQVSLRLHHHAGMPPFQASPAPGPLGASGGLSWLPSGRAGATRPSALDKPRPCTPHAAAFSLRCLPGVGAPVSPRAMTTDSAQQSGRHCSARCTLSCPRCESGKPGTFGGVLEAVSKLTAGE